MSRPPRPARQVCPLCSRDAPIRVEVIGPSLWRFTLREQASPWWIILLAEHDDRANG
jgi:hypothetical protein